MPLFIFTARSIVTKHNAALFAAASLAILAVNGAAYGNPNEGRNQAARHARPANEVNRLHSMPAVATKRPPFGWPVLVKEARKYVGTNPTARKKLWCATFMNMVLARAGYAGTGSDAARSFASYGKRIGEPRVGAIAVLSRGKNGGHVGIVTGVDANGNPIIVSGNHGRRVGEAAYPRTRVIAYVMPVERSGATQLASAAGPSLPPRDSDADDDGAIPSPIEELLAAINAERASDAQQTQQTQQMRQAQQTQRPAERAPVRRVAEPRRNYRVVQQVAAADVDLPRARPEHVYRVNVAGTGTPLPPVRAQLAPTPLPPARPQ